jgi:hypothetical protein
MVGPNGAVIATVSGEPPVKHDHGTVETVGQIPGEPPRRRDVNGSSSTPCTDGSLAVCAVQVPVFS